MTDDKLTNEQIIKVFELCLDEGDCKECLCYGAACITDNDVLTCLKRLKAENEQLRQLFVESGKEQDRLMAEIERLNAVSEICGDCHKKYAEKIQTAKSEAIKEFAERLHELLKFYYPEQKFVHTHIENLVKEMTE